MFFFNYLEVILKTDGKTITVNENLFKKQMVIS